MNRRTIDHRCSLCGAFIAAHCYGRVCSTCRIENPHEREHVRQRLELYERLAADERPLFEPTAFRLPPVAEVNL